MAEVASGEWRVAGGEGGMKRTKGDLASGERSPGEEGIALAPQFSLGDIARAALQDAKINDYAMTPASSAEAGANSGKDTAPRRPARWMTVVVAVGLMVLVFAAYRGAGELGFINLDDDAYVERQPMVNQGLRWATVVWAFSAAHSGMWHPLTTLSHAFDCEVFGVRPAPMHWESVGWHATNAVLVFAALGALTGAWWRAAAVAAIFALHPLGVESVAWIAERKNLLSTFFLLLGLGAYARYHRRQSWVAYGVVVGAMAMSLLSKPMAVTFPALLLVLDYWPLGRWPREGWRRLVGEKIPLLGVSLVHSAVTLQAQQSIGADDFGRQLDFGARLGNAVVSYARYLGKAIWPDALSVFYAHPGRWPLWATMAALALVATLTGLAWRRREQHPWFLAGWLWYVGTLVPVIGLVQVGAQAMADRYTYLPLLGIYVVVVWGAAAWLGRSRGGRVILGAVLAVGLGACFALTGRQVTAWENSLRLYERSIAAGGDNATLRYLLAMAHAAARSPAAEVVAQFQRALQLDANYTNALTQLAFVEFQQGRPGESEKLLRQVVALGRQPAAAHQSLGAFLLQCARLPEAEVEFREALRLRPNYAGAHQAMATILLGQQRTPEALAHLAAAVRTEPWNPDLRCELGIVCAMMKRFDEARAHLERAIWIRPQFPAARQHLATVLDLQRQAAGAAR